MNKIREEEIEKMFGLIPTREFKLITLITIILLLSKIDIKNSRLTLELEFSDN